jgi:hypothetical protein
MSAPSLRAPDYLTALVDAGFAVRAVALRGGHLQVGRAGTWNEAYDPAWAPHAQRFSGEVAERFVNVVVAQPEVEIGPAPVFEHFATINRPNVAITTMPMLDLPIEHVRRILRPLRHYDLVLCPTHGVARLIGELAEVADVQMAPPDAWAAWDQFRELFASDFKPRFRAVVH